jgi:mono/diheme cytochrome c family protein
MLSRAVERGAELVIEAQSATAKNALFLPLARIRFDREIDIDQEALHFQPFAGRGFAPYGLLTVLRERVYPVSAHARPPNKEQRAIRDRSGFFCRLLHGPYIAQRDGRCFSLRRAISAVGVLMLLAVIMSSGYAAWRFLPDYPMTNPPDQPDRDHNQAEIDAQRFKYGSTGGEANLGVPLLIWQATPLVCADTLAKVVGKRMAPDYAARVRNYSPRPSRGPDPARIALSVEGYRALGLIFETATDNAKDKPRIYQSEKDGKPNDIPVGTSMRRDLGLDRVFVNCAVCHSSTVRISPDAKPALVLGMPANLLDLRNFEDFLFTCTSGPDFSKDNLIPEIERTNGTLSLLDHYVLYPVAIWIIRDRVQYLASRLGFFAKQPEWGPGRVDTFSNAKGIFNWPWQKLPDWHKDHRVEKDQVGTVDFPSIWRQAARKTRADGCPMELHWDGNNDAVEERDLSAAFGTGALPPIIDHRNLGKLESWLLDRSEPPKFTAFGFPKEAFDQQLADKGKPIYARLCANCHGLSGSDFSGARVGWVTPIGDIETDRYRLDNYTEELSSTQAMLYADEKKLAGAGDDAPRLDQAHLQSCGMATHGDAQENTYRFKRFHKTNGYANLPLDGVWLRAPYLHNGSVPTLWDLLTPAEARPTSFYRGNDVYDWNKMGFASENGAAPDGTDYFKYDTSAPGNHNTGHTYGTDLSDDDKKKVIEYLKTF